MFGSVVLGGGILLLGTACALTAAVVRLRSKVKRANWIVTRVSAAIGEAERAGRLAGL